MKKVSLECGGKSPNLIFADVADIGIAAEAAARGIFANQGEVCSANSRLLVHRLIADEFVDSLARYAETIKIGHPLEPDTAMGPLVDSHHVACIEEFVIEVSSEAIVAGGHRRTVEGSDRYFEPTIVRADLLDTAAVEPRLLREEVFGPVLAVQIFDDEDEAIRLANDSIYGLAASIWTSDLSRALRISDRIHAGTVSVNTVDALSVCTPFGGFKQSGFSSDLSLHALDNYTGLKTTWINY